MFVHAVVSVVPRKEGGVTFFTFSECVQHARNLSVGKIESWIDMAVKDMRRLELLDQA